MDSFRLKTATRLFYRILLLALTFGLTLADNYEYITDNCPVQEFKPKIVFLSNERFRRDTTEVNSSSSVKPTNVTLTTTDNITSTVSATANTTIATPVVTSNVTIKNDQHLLGVNGSGILHVTVPNGPTVSDPIPPNDDTSDVFKETLETLKTEKNLTDVIEDHHVFYNSSFVDKLDVFNEFWKNITQEQAQIHDVLSNSHRRATTLKLSFEFLFYGNPVTNITVATGGFIYIGDHIHNWLAATQYIAPLMANFDTTLGNDSVVKQYDDGEKFVIFWENVTLQEDPNSPFTFAAVLYNNGDIVFAYKDIPYPIQNISDKEHPVKVGISDAYLTGQTFLHVKHKTIYEYHRVSFKHYEISNHTILKLTALPTCLVYDTCESCTNHETHFNCSWCPRLNKCSSGIDKLKYEWAKKSCVSTAITNSSMCPSGAQISPPDTHNTVYTTDNVTSEQVAQDANSSLHTMGTPEVPSSKPHSPIGGVVAAFVIVTLVCVIAAWVLYAFKNPHTRSGQLLIRYRPSQWSWRRGEARYTAATIHM